MLGGLPLGPSLIEEEAEKSLCGKRTEVVALETNKKKKKKMKINVGVLHSKEAA